MLRRSLICGLLAAAVLLAQTPPATPPQAGRGGQSGQNGQARPPRPEPPAQTTDPQIHDPVMIKQGDTYYAFGTGITVQSSKDLKTWNREPAPFGRNDLQWQQSLGIHANNQWAPDISFHNGKYYMYYAVSTFGKNLSAIGVATNATLNSKDPNYKWEDHGVVVNSVPGRDMWNAIDPNLIVDNDGKAWLNFGSFWDGIKLVRLKDNLTEVAEGPDREWHTIAARERYWKLDETEAGDAANPDLKYDQLYSKRILALDQQLQNGSVEAPFIFSKNGYYYLFVSWDRCCRGVNSTYKIMVGRSKKITGPYLDQTGQRMDWGGGTLVVKGVPESKKWAALGHNGTYTFDGIDYLVFHAYDKTDNGRSKLVIKKLDWDKDGWPSVTLDE